MGRGVQGSDRDAATYCALKKSGSLTSPTRRRMAFESRSPLGAGGSNMTVWNVACSPHNSDGTSGVSSTNAESPLASVAKNQEYHGKSGQTVPPRPGSKTGFSN